MVVFLKIWGWRICVRGVLGYSMVLNETHTLWDRVMILWIVGFFKMGCGYDKKCGVKGVTWDTTAVTRGIDSLSMVSIEYVLTKGVCH